MTRRCKTISHDFDGQWASAKGAEEPHGPWCHKLGEERGVGSAPSIGGESAMDISIKVG